MSTTRNLGLVKAIFVGTTAPSNTQVLWYDTSLPAPIHKYYDTLTTSWVALNQPDSNADHYRLNSYSISGTTTVVFSSVLASASYYVKVLKFTATDGTDVKSGFDIPDANKEVGQFRFIPPSRYQSGILWYEALIIK